VNASDTLRSDGIAANLEWRAFKMLVAMPPSTVTRVFFVCLMRLRRLRTKRDQVTPSPHGELRVRLSHVIAKLACTARGSGPIGDW